MIEIDGGAGEGGGQILRSSLAISILTGKPFKLLNIPRIAANRGFNNGTDVREGHRRHLRHSLQRHAVGSSTLFFEPGDVQTGDYTFTIGTAGTTALVLHTVYLPLALHRRAEHSDDRGRNAQPAHHRATISTRSHRAVSLGIRIEQEMVRPGFYPRGGGEIRPVIHPCSRISGLTLTECPDLTTAGGFSMSELAGIHRQAAGTTHRHQAEAGKDQSHIPINGTAAWGLVALRR